LRQLELLTALYKLSTLLICLLTCVWSVQYDVSTAGGLLDIALGGHYSESAESSTELNKFLSCLPDYTVSIGWIATYESWIV